MIDWTAAEILLGAAVLALAMPREDGFILPERRDWTGWLRRLWPAVRRRREEEAGREADQYVTDLRTDRDQEPMTLRQDQLPSLHRVYQGPVVTPPAPVAEGQEAQRPPWPTAENPAWSPQAKPQESPQELPQERRRRRAPGDPPTIVIELMRPAISGDLGRYLAELPGYTDLGESPDVFFVPRSSLALGAPDDDGAPQHVDDDQGQEHHLAPLQGQVDDAEVDMQEAREQGPGDGQLQQHGVPSPGRQVPGPEEPGDEREEQRG